MRPVSVLLVCTENLCRSPLAEGLLRQHLKQAGLHRQVRVDSAGTYCSRPGLKPDPRSVRVAKAHGVSLRGIRARRITAADMDQHDLVLVMDEDNRRNLLDQYPAMAARVELILAYAPDVGLVEVPDPYYGNAAGFERVFELLHEAMAGLMAALAQRVAAR